MSMKAFRTVAILAAVHATAAPLAAQGAGSTPLEVAQAPAGARAGALGGAYTGVWGDTDVIFYNPAALAGIGPAVSLSHQQHVMDVSFGSLAAALQAGRISVGVGIAWMSAGDVDELVPDPDFGGQRGRLTGATAGARESLMRVAAALPLMNDRVLAGAAVGAAVSDLAGLTRSGAFVDLGAQARLAEGAVVGLSLRNLGGSVSGGGAEPADLPLEARLGASYALPVGGALGALLTADLIQRVREETTAFAGGLEFGLAPPPGGLGAVARIGYRVEQDLDAASALQLGGGISYANFSLDYQYQNIELFGTAHRIGLRWRGR
jgi:hypothetical protein